MLWRPAVPVLLLFAILLLGCANVGQPPSQVEPDLSNPVMQPRVIGENKTLAVGNIEISYYSVAASYDVISLGVDFFIRARNNGVHNETLSATLASTPPAFTWQLFFYQNESFTLAPGEEKTLHYFASNDEPGQADLLFDFWQKPDKSDKATANITLFRGSDRDENLTKSAIVYGRVSDKATGNPVFGADVVVNLFSGRGAYEAKTDWNGNYAVAVPGVDDIASFLGPASGNYRSLNYSITISYPGYGYLYLGNVSPMRGEKLQVDILLSPFSRSASYALDWESNVSEPYGFFRVAADKDWNYAVAVQAKHSPELNVPSLFFVFDAKTGKQVFSQATQNECWGVSMSSDGKTVAAACSDGYVYALGISAGNVSLKWSARDPTGNMRRWVEISHDGKLVLTGPLVAAPSSRYAFVLLNASTGELVRGFEGDFAWLRNARFSADDSRLVVGGSDGVLEMYETASGKKLWENRIGEFPFVLEMDGNGNTYATGKGRTIYSFDPSGKERWSFRVPDHAPYAGAISADGSKLAFSTMQGWVYYVDTATGGVYWRKRIASNNAAFNALSMSADGKTIAVGGAPQNLLQVLDDKGNTLFGNTAPANDDPALAQKWAGIGYKASDNTQRGTMGTFMSADGSRILAAYGDDYVREFSRR